MALRFIDSCDHYATADINKKWTYPTAVIANNGRNGTNCLRHTAQSTTSKVIDHQSTLIFGAAFFFRAAGNGVSASPLIIFQDLTGLSIVNQVYVTFNNDQTFSIISGVDIHDNPIVLAQSSATAQLNTYQYIEFKATISSSISAHTCQLSLNGTVIADAPAASNTKQSSNSTANTVAIFTPYFGSMDWDDVYICDGTVGAAGASRPNNDFLGLIIVEAIYPVGVGAASDFTNSGGNHLNNYTYVNETPPDNDTTYVKSSNPGDFDLYAYGSIFNTSTIYGVSHILDVRKDQAGARVAAPMTRIASTNYQGNNIPLTSEYQYNLQISEINPATTAVWSKNDVNNAQFGIKLVS